VTDGTGSTIGGVRAVLRAEGLVVLGGALFLYADTGRSWWLFAALFLAPDLSMLGYLASPRVGALAYNALHSYVAPLALAGVSRGDGLGFALALIAVAHIGFDRAMGYGLKYSSAFAHTHLGRIGRPPSAASAG